MKAGACGHSWCVCTRARARERERESNGREFAVARAQASLVARSALLSLGVGSPNSPRRSEWPMSTHLRAAGRHGGARSHARGRRAAACFMPMSAIWSTAISPVYAPVPVKLQFWGASSAPLVNLPAHSATCSGLGHTYTSHLAVLHALMFLIRPSISDADLGLHFQLPPTIGLRDMWRIEVRSRDRAPSMNSIACLPCWGCVREDAKDAGRGWL